MNKIMFYEPTAENKTNQIIIIGTNSEDNDRSKTVPNARSSDY